MLHVHHYIFEVFTFLIKERLKNFYFGPKSIFRLAVPLLYHNNSVRVDFQIMSWSAQSFTLIKESITFSALLGNRLPAWLVKNHSFKLLSNNVILFLLCAFQMVNCQIDITNPAVRFGHLFYLWSFITAYCTILLWQDHYVTLKLLSTFYDVCKSSKIYPSSNFNLG